MNPDVSINRAGCAEISIVGMGFWGCRMLDGLPSEVAPLAAQVAVHDDPLALAVCRARTLIALESGWETVKMSGADPDCGYCRLQEAVAGDDLVFLLGDPGEAMLPRVLDDFVSRCHGLGILTVFVCPASVRVTESLAVHSSQMTLSVPDGLDASVFVSAFCQAICSIILMPGMIGVDFADVRTVLEESGNALASVAVATGDHRAHEVALAALHPDSDMARALPTARALLAVIMTVKDDFGLDEFTEIADWLSRFVAPDATVIIGGATDVGLSASEMKLLLVASGVENLPWPRVTGSAPQS